MPEPVKVYVVDDEPVIAWTLAAILNASGFQATAYTHPEEAIRAGECGGPSLLIADVVMPDIDWESFERNAELKGLDKPTVDAMRRVYETCKSLRADIS